jgi:hypothetical protein
MAKKSKKDRLIDLMILLFVAACALIILRALYRNVREELWVRDVIGMCPFTEHRDRVSGKETQSLPARTGSLPRLGDERRFALGDMPCKPA